MGNLAKKLTAFYIARVECTVYINHVILDCDKYRSRVEFITSNNFHLCLYVGVIVLFLVIPFLLQLK